MATLQIALQNHTDSSNVFAYITGLASDNGNKLFLLQSDASTAYYPDNPSQEQSAPAKDIAIDLGSPGNTVFATIPHIAGGRIWFSIGSKLKFFLNPGDNGPALVEPSSMNSADVNHGKHWDFCEFTFNPGQVSILTSIDFKDASLILNRSMPTSPTSISSAFPSV
jgi:hypothetical protein